MATLGARLRVYVVTAEGRDHVALARAAGLGGAGAVQLRAPELRPEERRRVATEFASVCRQFGLVGVVNDDLDLAVEIGAGGVHLGQRDRARWGGTWAEVRRRLPPHLLLGVSVDDPGQAREAADAGADYLGVTIYATATKHDARPVGLDALRAIRTVTDLPLVAIGGIDAGNAAAVLSAGADGVAVISAVAEAPDPVAAVRDLVRAVG